MNVQPRARRSRDELERMRMALWSIANDEQPMTLRNLYYRAVVNSLVEKTDRGYDTVGRLVLEMRRAGRMPWEWIHEIRDWRLPTHAAKPKDIAAGWVGECCEAEAIPIAQMRALVDEAIRDLVDQDVMDATTVAEHEDRERLEHLLRGAA